MRLSRPAWALPAAAAALFTACREDLPPFEANDRPPADSSAVRLTYSPGDDRAPVWSADGDTVFFNAEGTGELSGNPGVLLAIPRQGGAARVVLQTVQSPSSREIPWLVTPAPDPTSPRLAFIEVVKLWDPHGCSLELTRLVCVPELEEPSARRPSLDLITLHIRARAASGPLDEDTALELELPGVESQSDGGVNTSVVHNYPFQQVFIQETGYTFRASWAPDGERIAVSDGLRVLVWEVGHQAVDTVPGTADGAWPSWSPDGEWIAFTRLERADSSFTTCDYIGGLGV
ncbi:MAG: PD40 domain-containing protein, partial [Gemmatimonadota bacterium]